MPAHDSGSFASSSNDVVVALSRSLQTAAAGSDPDPGQSALTVHMIEANPSHVPAFGIGDKDCRPNKRGYASCRRCSSPGASDNPSPRSLRCRNFPCRCMLLPRSDTCRY